ncbi:hypothetical protein ACFQPF_00860 [Fictibacillus iocasae]|uniref:Uncharacterized protein n=1 Tax=Fictibacillus iocasae TaxID=2715437 RepID=A0ABW2NLA2_9BACL
MGTRHDACTHVMSKNQVVDAVTNYLQKERYYVNRLNKSNEADVMAANEYHTLYIEAEGNEEAAYSRKLEADFSCQVMRLLKKYDKEPGRTLVLANPDTPFLRERASSLKDALDQLEIVRFWVKKDGGVEWE